MAGLTIAIVTVLAALPWGMPDEARFLLPLLPYSVVHFWTVARIRAVPEWVAFASGLATDVLSHGPLGFWSLTFLLGYMTCLFVQAPSRWGPIGQWGQFALTISIMAFGQWLLASAYLLDAADWRPLARSGTLAAMLYPLLWLFLRSLARERVDFPWHGRNN